MSTPAKKLVKSPAYISEVSDSASVGRIERSLGDQIFISFERTSPWPSEDYSYVLSTLALASFSMSLEQAEALHQALGDALKKG